MSNRERLFTGVFFTQKEALEKAREVFFFTDTDMIRLMGPEIFFDSIGSLWSLRSGEKGKGGTGRF